MTTYVLVHGSCLGGWVWGRVRPILENRGHRVLAPSLTGLSDRAHLAGPEVGLTTHIQDIARLLEWEELEDVVLVGASYAGMVITGVAGIVPERIGHLVYLDAFWPKPGQSAFDQLPHLPAQLLGAATAEQPWAFPLPKDLSSFGLVDPTDLAFMHNHTTPMPILTHSEPLPEPIKLPAEPIPTTYVQGAALPIFDKVAEMAEAEGARVILWEDASHILPVTHPARIADLLLDIGS